MIEQEGDGGCRSSMLLPTPSLFFFFPQARIRHMFMTSKQIRDERLQKYRVGFMGMRLARSFDKDD